MRTRSAALLLSATFIVGACGGAPAPPGTGGATGPLGASPASPGAAQPGGALTLTGTPDESTASEGQVTVAGGGTVTATGADGSSFELVVPPGAVAVDTTIRLTPLANARVLDGSNPIEGSGPLHVVRLEPDGLEFFELVRLTITPATPIPVDQQLALTAAGDGTDVELALIDPAAAPMVLLLEHFSEGALGQFTPDQQGTMKSKSATNAERNINNQIRDLLREERERELLGEEERDLTEALAKLLEDFQREVLDKRKEAAALSCDRLYAYLQALLSFERQVQLLGAGSAATYAAVMEEVRRIVVERYPECEREAKDKCITAKDPAILVRFWLANTAAGVQVNQPVAAEMQLKAERICKPEGYQFQFTGTGTGKYFGYPAPITWSYWGVLCPKAESWQVWEIVDHEQGSENTGSPDTAGSIPLSVTFDQGGAMNSATWPYLGKSPPGYLLHKTMLTLSPPDAPTLVTASISAGQIDLAATAPVEPYDGSFGSCEEASPAP